MKAKPSQVRWAIGFAAAVAMMGSGCMRIRVEIVGPGPWEPCAAGPGHNQTSANAFEIYRADPGALGTGVYLSSTAKPAIQVVPDLTYPECTVRGASFEAFKCIPTKLMTLAQVQEQLALGCDGGCAIGYAIGYQQCEDPCLCKRGVCMGEALALDAAERQLRSSATSTRINPGRD